MPGLAAERTLLSWERSSFGFLVAGALMLLPRQGPLGSARVLLAIAAMVLALLVLALGYRRSRQIRESPLVEGRTVTVVPRTGILVIGCATSGFAAAVAVVLLLYTV